jgi:hypothetical protein
MMKRKGRSTLPLFNLASMTLKTYKTAKLYPKKLFSLLRKALLKKKLKDEKTKLFKSQTPIKKVAIGLRTKTKDIIGSYRFITSTFSRST